MANNQVQKGRQKKGPITDKDVLKSLSEEYEKVSPAHYLLFACPVAFGVPINKLVSLDRKKLFYYINLKNIMPDVFTEEKIKNNYLAATSGKTKDDYIFTPKKKSSNAHISRITSFKWLKSVSESTDVSAESLIKTHDYFKSKCREE